MTYPGIENSPAAAAVNPDRVAVEERRREREEEFGTWVAAQEIPWGNVTAFWPGERVPASTVQAYGWDGLGLVVKRGTAAGRQVLEAAGAATTEERERWAGEDKAAAEKARPRAESAGKQQSITGEKGGN